jgi:hypothetical protein
MISNVTMARAFQSPSDVTGAEAVPTARTKTIVNMATQRNAKDSSAMTESASRTVNNVIMKGIATTERMKWVVKTRLSALLRSLSVELVKVLDACQSCTNAIKSKIARTTKTSATAPKIIQMKFVSQTNPHAMTEVALRQAIVVTASPSALIKPTKRTAMNVPMALFIVRLVASA